MWDRAKHALSWSVPLTPIGLLGAVDWYTVSIKTAGFIISMAAALTATATITLFLRRNGGTVVKIWHELASLGATRKKVDELADVIMPEGQPHIGQQLARVQRDMRVHDFKMKAFQDAGNVMTFEANAAGRWTWVSDSFEAFIGVKQPNDLLGLGWLTRVDDGERNSVSREWAQAILERRTFDLAVLFRRLPDDDPGEPDKWVRIIASPVHEGEGEEAACYTGHGRRSETPPNAPVVTVAHGKGS